MTKLQKSLCVAASGIIVAVATVFVVKAVKKKFDEDFDFDFDDFDDYEEDYEEDESTCDFCNCSCHTDSDAFKADDEYTSVDDSVGTADTSFTSEACE